MHKYNGYSVEQRIRQTLAFSAPLLITAAILSCLDYDKKKNSSAGHATSSSSSYDPSRTIGSKQKDGGKSTIPMDVLAWTPDGIAWSCPKDPYAKEFGENVLQQLRGRYLIGRNGHLYLKMSNEDHVALLRRLHPRSDPGESWSFLCEITNFSCARVFPQWFRPSSVDNMPGLKWRGDFLLFRWSASPADKTDCRFFSYKTRSWSGWERIPPFITASGALRGNQWVIQWSGGIPNSEMQLSTSVRSNTFFTRLYSKPFFLLPVCESDIPADIP